MRTLIISLTLLSLNAFAGSGHIESCGALSIYNSIDKKWEVSANDSTACAPVAIAEVTERSCVNGQIIVRMPIQSAYNDELYHFDDEKYTEVCLTPETHKGLISETESYFFIDSLKMKKLYESFYYSQKKN